MNEDEIWRMEQEEPPSRHPGLDYQEIRPVLKEKDYNDLKGCFLLPEHGPKDIQPNVCYYTRHPETGKEQVKFLVLPGVLRNEYIRARLALEEAKWGAATRDSAAGQPNPRKLTWGFIPQTPGHVVGSGYESIRSKPTLEQPWLAHGLKPLVKKMNACLAEYLPVYYPRALDHALHAEQRDDVKEDDWTRIPSFSMTEMPDPWES